MSGLQECGKRPVERPDQTGQTIEKQERGNAV